MGTSDVYGSRSLACSIAFMVSYDGGSVHGAWNYGGKLPLWFAVLEANIEPGPYIALVFGDNLHYPAYMHLETAESTTMALYALRWKEQTSHFVFINIWYCHSMSKTIL
ncbi:hypothetical protein [Absidia glauca]|uniref:Uncharacterized protein n=1 Tax=Absidia glauca TaxID=4829 RepID=A0A163JAQ0_ABSGL|nr:hypothetical protein [Absidia glauca]